MGKNGTSNKVVERKEKRTRNDKVEKKKEKKKVPVCLTRHQQERERSRVEGDCSGTGPNHIYIYSPANHRHSSLRTLPFTPSSPSSFDYHHFINCFSIIITLSLSLPLPLSCPALCTPSHSSIDVFNPCLLADDVQTFRNFFVLFWLHCQATFKNSKRDLVGILSLW